ncbi:MAG: glycosyltransferase family 4 protein [Rhodospirillales bacterium]
MPPFLGIGWQIGTNSGWGVFGFNLARELMRRGAPEPLMLYPPGDISVVGVEDADMLDHMLDRFQEIKALCAATPEGRNITIRSALVLHSLGNKIMPNRKAENIQGGVNAGMIFFEFTALDAEARARARAFDRIIAGSTWNAEVLRAAGVDDVRVALQGVDTGLFLPQPKRGTWGNRFTVFSGGKLEHRKGQDIVLRAFQEFHRRRPDSVLITAWQNPWPHIAKTVTAGGLTDAAPEIDGEGRIHVESWAAGQGLPKGAVVDLGELSNHQVAGALREADAALFPNRCEGGTNLPAMEAMACGIPVILSNNTGHKDLMTDSGAYVLEHQGPVTAFAAAGTEGWGESSPEEAAALLEEIYTQRDEARRRADQGAAFMRNWSWKHQIAGLLEQLEGLG